MKTNSKILLLFATGSSALGLARESLMPNVPQEIGWLLLFIGAISFIAAFMLWFKNKSAYRSVSSVLVRWRSRKGRKQTKNSEPNHDEIMPAWTAIKEHIAPHQKPDDQDGKSIGRVLNTSVYAPFNEEIIDRAVAAFVMAAFDEKITVWGREEGDSTTKTIEKWFWKDATLDRLLTVAGNQGVFCEKDFDPQAPLGSQRRKIIDCVVDRRQIERIWPHSDRHQKESE